MAGDLTLLLLGVLAAGLGGEFFVRGIVGIAGWLRIPAGLIAATAVAFATSSPELSVAINAALSDQPAIALGDAIGSNVVNIALVFGLALVVTPLVVGRADLRRDLPFAFAAPLLTAALLLDGRLGRIDGLALVIVFATWLAITVLQAVRARSAASAVLGERRAGRALAAAAVGLTLLIVAGRLIVLAAKGIGDALGFDPFVVGATLVALGTSTPELATTVIARVRGHDEISVGTVIGSNIFNNLWIVGVAALITPIRPGANEAFVGLAFGVLALALITPLSARTRFGRGRGLLLLGVYVAYALTLLLVVGGEPARADATV